MWEGECGGVAGPLRKNQPHYGAFFLISAILVTQCRSNGRSSEDLERLSSPTHSEKFPMRKPSGFGKSSPTRNQRRRMR